MSTPYTQSEQEIISRALCIITERSVREPKGIMTSPTTTTAALRLHYAELDCDREHFSIMFLNTQHGVIAIESLFSGTVDGAAVYPRVIVKRALELNAAGLVLAHNHPSGVTEPSTADRRITTRIVDACQLVDIRVLDHIILGADRYSFAEAGLI